MIPICHDNTHCDENPIVALPLISIIMCIAHCLHVSLAINAPERREGDETLLYCASQSCVMLDALVIFLPFQSGSTPNHGRVLQNSGDLRIQVDGGPW